MVDIESCTTAYPPMSWSQIMNVSPRGIQTATTSNSNSHRTQTILFATDFGGYLLDIYSGVCTLNALTSGVVSRSKEISHVLHADSLYFQYVCAEHSSADVATTGSVLVLKIEWTLAYTLFAV